VTINHFRPACRPNSPLVSTCVTCNCKMGKLNCDMGSCKRQRPSIELMKPIPTRLVIGTFQVSPPSLQQPQLAAAVVEGLLSRTQPPALGLAVSVTVLLSQSQFQSLSQSGCDSPSLLAARGGSLEDGGATTGDGFGVSSVGIKNARERERERERDVFSGDGD
jgi:hypothetical protein